MNEAFFVSTQSNSYQVQFFFLMPSLKAPTLNAKFVCFAVCWKFHFPPIFLQNVAKTVRLQLSVSLRIPSLFPLLAAFSCRFTTSDENAILKLICLEEFPPKMNPLIVQNIATIILPL